MDFYRSIPACAGEPFPQGQPTPLIRVYPRVCGGTVKSGVGQRSPGGLSPRVRGNLNAGQDAAAAPRSIPACAGEPYAEQLAIRCYRVYPRVCGGTLNGAE